MAPPVTVYEGVLLAALLVTAGVTTYAFRRRAEPGAGFVVVYAAASTLWSGGELATSIATGFPAKAGWFHVLFVGVIVSVPAWFLFVLVYTGRWHLVTRRSIAAVGAVPAAAVLLTLTNPLHGLVFAELFPIQSGAGLDVVPGAAFYPWAGYSIVLVVSSVVFLVDAVFRVQRLYRWQIAFLAVGSVAPAAGSLVGVVGLSPVDLTPVGLAVAGSALAVAISRTGFLDVTPVAGSAVMDTIDAGVFVVDRRGRLVGANAQAVTMLEEESAPVGRSMEEVLAPFPDARERHREMVETGLEETELTVAGRRYHVAASPLSDYRDRVLGRVFLVTDVTEQRRRERELTRQNERLDEFASIVSHDLRNPLNVAGGNLALAREDRDDEHVAAAAEAIGRMEAIVDDVLTIARNGRTVSEEALEATSLRSVAESAWASIPSGDAALVVEADLELAADPDRLQRALENLFRNAVVHGTAAGGGGQPTDDSTDPPVTVRVGPLDASDEDATRRGFYVEDGGRGIPPGERERVLESGYSTDPDGTGYGLAIVSSVVSAHGWELAVTESAEGGARFEVTGVRTEPP